MTSEIDESRNIYESGKISSSNFAQVTEIPHKTFAQN